MKGDNMKRSIVEVAGKRKILEEKERLREYSDLVCTYLLINYYCLFIFLL